tara:strand:- start:278 stop:664 length:387 start_codon:yes stop_codon:yes gene_type:complete
MRNVTECIENAIERFIEENSLTIRYRLQHEGGIPTFHIGGPWHDVTELYGSLICDVPEYTSGMKFEDNIAKVTYQDGSGIVAKVYCSLRPTDEDLNRFDTLAALETLEEKGILAKRSGQGSIRSKIYH